jgi:hypothetical protein
MAGAPNELRPLCFVAMPFGTKSGPSASAPPVPFDSVYQAMKVAVEQVGLDCRRADFDPSGGFIHRSMFEALLVAEYVVVDLTFANANVAYEVGLRHGANAGRGTILVCEKESLAWLPFDFRPFRLISYEVSALDGLTAALAERLGLAAREGLPPDNPILQLTSIRANTTGHEKTDIFAARMAYLTEHGERVAAILRRGDAAQAVRDLQQLEAETLAAAKGIAQIHTALMAIYLGYRAKKAWPAMVSLYQKMPRELQESAVAREQLGLGHNRIAEGAADEQTAREERAKALAAIDALPKDRWTSETYGILGRIQKGRADGEARGGHDALARAALSAAIDAYEAGLRADPRDYYPGVNAVTLRVLRNAPEDERALADILPVVRFAVRRAPAPTHPDESYWQTATELELASTARDWQAADHALEKLLGIQVDGWMFETTRDNLRRQAKARVAEPETTRHLEGYVRALDEAAR